jgi:hypothetical protein
MILGIGYILCISESIGSLLKNFYYFIKCLKSANFRGFIGVSCVKPGGKEKMSGLD